MMADSAHAPASEAPAELRAAALHWLRVAAPQAKRAGVQALAAAFAQGRLRLDVDGDPLAALARAGEATGSDESSPEGAGIPGRPPRPSLVPPGELPMRGMGTAWGRAAQIHAMAHIEFNAINLALDALARFSGLPPAYYADWLRVAEEEALHFDLLDQHLCSLGFAYGDFPAHNGLWEMAERTADDVLARMALVPRTLEARGLDASPQVRAKLWQAGDRRAAEILDVILRDEIGHVAIGNHWFYFLCQARGLEPLSTQALLAERYRAPRLHGPFNLQARRQAGFAESELALLESASPRAAPRPVEPKATP
jgi:uncharacterized ferritin-like protein (DUF455 family)